ncbi:hypothetical protein ACFL3H_05395 [Gemmatimonadota bacterium]
MGLVDYLGKKRNLQFDIAQVAPREGVEGDLQPRLVIYWWCTCACPADDDNAHHVQVFSVKWFGSSELIVPVAQGTYHEFEWSKYGAVRKGNGQVSVSRRRVEQDDASGSTIVPGHSSVTFLSTRWHDARTSASRFA